MLDEVCTEERDLGTMKMQLSEMACMLYVRLTIKRVPLSQTDGGHNARDTMVKPSGTNGCAYCELLALQERDE